MSQSDQLELPVDGEPDALPRSVPVHLLLLAGPIIASMLSRTVMSMADFVMVSRLGTDAMAAIMPASMLMFIGGAFGWGVMGAVNTYVSQSLGRKRYEDCSVYTWQGFYLSLAIGAVMLTLLPFVRPLFEFSGHGPAIVEMEIDYATIGLLGVGPSVACLALSNFFNGIHKPGIATWSVILSNIINIILNYALIFGHWGAPAMGISGAAWATFIATVLQLVMLAGWMWLPHYASKYKTRTTLGFHRGRMLKLLNVGLPTGVQYVTDVMSWAIFTIFLVGQFGKAQLAGNNAAFKTLEFCFMPVVGLGVALGAAVGKSIGEGRLDLAQEYVRWTRRIAIGYMCTAGTVMALFRHDLLALFLPGETPDADVLYWGGRIMIVCAIFQLFDAIAITYHSALRGAGDTRWPAFVQGFYSVVVCLGGGYLMTEFFPELGSVGPWIAFAAYILCVGVTLLFRYNHGHWKSIDLHDSDGTADPVV